MRGVLRVRLTLCLDLGCAASRTGASGGLVWPPCPRRFGNACLAVTCVPSSLVGWPLAECMPLWACRLCRGFGAPEYQARSGGQGEAAQSGQARLGEATASRQDSQGRCPVVSVDTRGGTGESAGRQAQCGRWLAGVQGRKGPSIRAFVATGLLDVFAGVMLSANVYDKVLPLVPVGCRE
jgi:hypothetical protein